MESIRRVGRSIVANVYAVAVIYVRFAILTLIIYLLAQWFFVEFEMMARDKEAAAAKSSAASGTTTTTTTASSSTTTPPPLHGGEL